VIPEEKNNRYKFINFYNWTVYPEQRVNNNTFTEYILSESAVTLVQ
jgi:hypothetical protein